MRDFNSVSLNYWVIRKQIHYLQKSEASLLKEDLQHKSHFLTAASILGASQKLRELNS